ncbi:putative bifunctional diguanylate cyclase/phosphodiesterase [Neptuniibacter halophilus]|uniref:putative bifunctional diguanylate cyclase/phosphodiesterase n=1 Tax=Neptuniibacter halophilus TaxID=651666 RepID=UPI002573F4A8|nr:EAL domain-containing protein [Neptuniibacter halophilus]
MIYPAQNSDEFLAVRTNRYNRLCKLLLIIGIVFLLIFGGLSLLDEKYLLGGVLMSCMLGCCIALHQLIQHHNSRFAVRVLNTVSIFLSLTLLVTGGRENTGVYWIYPILAINIFINRFWQAVILYGGFLIVCALLLLTPLSELMVASYSFTEALRIEFTLLALYLICLATLNSEELANNLLIKMHDDDMHKMAFFDTLTGLPNRWNIKNRLTLLVKKARKKPRNIGLLYIDLDNFKKVNDNYGHDMGDKLLTIFSNKLQQLAQNFPKPSRIELARMAGDEFVVVIDAPDHSARSIEMAEQILRLFKDGLEVENINHSVFASIGIALYPEHANSAGDLIHRADLAMYQAKDGGRNRYEYYSAELARELRDQEQIENRLRLALRENLFSLVYMPIFDCHSMSIVGVEVLLRAENLQMDGIGPERFIPVAEKTNLIKEIDLWVIDNALKQLLRLQQETGFSGLFCINISGVELSNEQFTTQVKQSIDRYGVAPESIEFEITETAFVLNDDRSRTILQELRELGVSLALDDFGTGFTAFNQLIHYPADSLKIDRTFVSDLFSTDKSRHNMVGIIENLARLYQIKVIAEGVETQAQLEYLQEIGCDWVQGYYLSRPLHWDDLLSFISEYEAHGFEVNPQNLNSLPPIPGR